MTEPSLYFGELSNDYVFVRTGAREFHYPNGEDNVTTIYDGEGGVPLGSLFRKLRSACGSARKMLLANDITTESRVLFHRRINERVQRIAPFLSYDPTRISPSRTAACSGSRTPTRPHDQYPYSTPAATGMNYIRNAVKVVIDAYHGTYALLPGRPEGSRWPPRWAGRFPGCSAR